MNLEILERFVLETIDLILANPKEYEAEAVKSTIAYRFELYRQTLEGGRRENSPLRPPEININHFPQEQLKIPPPKIHRLTKKALADIMTNSVAESTNKVDDHEV